MFNKAAVTLSLLMCLTGCGESVPFSRIEQILQHGSLITAVVNSGHYKTGVQTGSGQLAQCTYQVYRFRIPSDGSSVLTPTEALDGSIGLGPIDIISGRTVEFFQPSGDHLIRFVSDYRCVHVQSRVAIMGHRGGVWSVISSYKYSDPGEKRSVIASDDGESLVFTNPFQILDVASLAWRSEPSVEREAREAFKHADAYPTDFLFTSNNEFLSVRTDSPEFGPPLFQIDFPDYFTLGGERLHRQLDGFYVDGSGVARRCENGVLPERSSSGVQFVRWRDRDMRIYSSVAGAESTVQGSICKTLGKPAFCLDIKAHKLVESQSDLLSQEGMPVFAEVNNMQRLFILRLPSDCIH